MDAGDRATQEQLPREPEWAIGWLSFLLVSQRAPHFGYFFGQAKKMIARPAGQWLTISRC